MATTTDHRIIDNTPDTAIDGRQFVVVVCPSDHHPVSATVEADHSATCDTCGARVAR